MLLEREGGFVSRDRGREIREGRLIWEIKRKSGGKRRCGPYKTLFPPAEKASETNDASSFPERSSTN